MKVASRMESIWTIRDRTAKRSSLKEEVES